MVSETKKFDNRDDRREIWFLLARLPPLKRVQFLQRCCERSSLGNSPTKPGVDWPKMRERVKAANRGDDKQDEGLTNEVYADLFMLSLQYGLKVTDVAPRLERLVKSLR